MQTTTKFMVGVFLSIAVLVLIWLNLDARTNSNEKIDVKNSAPKSGTVDQHKKNASSKDAEDKENLASSHSADVNGVLQQENKSLHSPVEANYLNVRGLDGRAADRVLKSDKFDQLLNEMMRESDAEAVARANIYGSNLAQNLSVSDPELKIQGIACGNSTCMLSISGSKNNGVFANTIAVTAESPKTRMYSITTYTQVDPASPNRFTYRAIFTTNPKFNAISVPN